MPLVPLTVNLNTDAGNRRFNGPNGKIFAGTNTSDANYAAAHVLLVKADGTTPLVVASNADAVSNTQDQVPTSARLQVYNGTTWDRARGDTTNGLDVDVTRLPALVAGSAIVGKVGIDQTTPGTTNGVQLTAGTAAFGKLAANSGVDIGDVDVTSITPGTAAASLGKAEDAVHTSGDVGVMALGVRQDVPAALATPTGDYTPFEVDPLGGMWVRQQTVAASTDVSLASAATSAQLLAANTARRGLLLTNTDANAVYLYYGTAATAAKFTVKIPADGYWEMPVPIYTGRIDCVWSSDGAGSLIGSEL